MPDAITYGQDFICPWFNVGFSADPNNLGGISGRASDAKPVKIEINSRRQIRFHDEVQVSLF